MKNALEALDRKALLDARQAIGQLHAAKLRALILGSHVAASTRLLERRKREAEVGATLPPCRGDLLRRQE